MFKLNMVTTLLHDHVPYILCYLCNFFILALHKKGRRNCHIKMHMNRLLVQNVSEIVLLKHIRMKGKKCGV